MMTTPLNTTQLEILKLFSRDLPETDLLALKRVLVRFLAERATQMADAIYEQKGWTEKDMTELAHTHLRTPYKRLKKNQA